MNGAYLGEAARAILEEHRRTTAGVELSCRGACPIEENSRIYRLDVGVTSNFDWTWEGSKAFRIDERTAWAGEVVEVDPDAGHVYVHCDTATPPCAGRFLVQPFGFLEALHSAYNEPERADALRPRLRRALPLTLGECPAPNLPAGPSLESLRTIWKYPLALIWGPPGTGKTYAIGQQVAHMVRDSNERILVVSTTNLATDGVALSIGRALQEVDLSIEGILRVGSGSNIRRFEDAGLEQMLPGRETELRERLAQLELQRQRVIKAAERARLNHQIQQVRLELSESSRFLDGATRVVISTVFNGLQQLMVQEIAEAIQLGDAPFDTVIVDEAGLVSRTAAAALSLHARRRFVAVGDPYQLAPISRMSRTLKSQIGRWLGYSALSHLRADLLSPGNVHLLHVQRRMCPAIREVVSRYQYGGLLEDAPEVRERPDQVDSRLADQPRAIWYVLDEESPQRLARIRAQRGPGQRSWVRIATRDVLDKLHRTHPELAASEVLFISPFKAQVRFIRSYLLNNQMERWNVATVHSQQGAEADTIIFDTVNASSTGWHLEEWRRLVNVAISRSRKQLIFLASRDEMRQPYLVPLQASLKPMHLSSGGLWSPVEFEPESLSDDFVSGPELGYQLVRRSAMRPVLSREQQQLATLRLDGKPRLVRGVAGSGKTYVLSRWLIQTLSREDFTGRAWVIFGNQALRGLLLEFIQQSWQKRFPLLQLPYERFDLWHIRDLLTNLLSELGVRVDRGDFDYEGMARRLLVAGGDRVDPRCQALFVDEAQDLGHDTLQLLCRLVEPFDEDKNSRSVLIFYDNAQNVYRRATPRWKDFGLDMRGRSTIMKESFRSTRPIAEFALNLLDRLWPDSVDSDLQEMIARRLVEVTLRNERRWLKIHHNQTEGPAPEFTRFVSRKAELSSLAKEVLRLIVQEKVRPGDIKILCNSEGFRQRVTRRLRHALAPIAVDVDIRTTEGSFFDGGGVVVSTPHSFKGYEAEIVLVPGADLFIAGGEVLHFPLYVALTRARSLLQVSALSSNDPNKQRIVDALQQCWEDQSPDSSRPLPLSPYRLRDDLVDRLGADQAGWVDQLLDRFALVDEPLLDDDGAILAEPLFWIESGGRKWACFGDEMPAAAVRTRLQDHQIELLVPGTFPG